MPAVKLDADTASGDWTLDALVSRHSSLTRPKYSRPCNPCACRAEQPGPPAASTCPVQDKSLHHHLQPHAQALQDLDHRLVARLGARCERLVEAFPSKTWYCLPATAVIPRASATSPMADRNTSGSAYSSTAVKYSAITSSLLRCSLASNFRNFNFITRLPSHPRPPLPLPNRAISSAQVSALLRSDRFSFDSHSGKTSLSRISFADRILLDTSSSRRLSRAV
jgi:hypothetical protein